MSLPVALDLARLFIGPWHRTPRGIDRVDLGYARHFLQEWSGPCFATLPTPWGVRSFDRRCALDIVTAVDDHWRENGTADDDPALRAVKSWLGGRPPDRPCTTRLEDRCRAARGFVRIFADAGFSFGRSAAGSLPFGTVYLNTGQIGLTLPRMLGWLNRRPDIAAVFMLHDTIPIEYPEFVPALSSRFHRKMVAAAARHAAGLIVTTSAAGASVKAELGRRGRPDIPVVAAPLPPAPKFLAPAASDPQLSAKPYFVVCGAIEPRKNHALLLNVWRELVRELGAAAPRLVVAGTRWCTSPSVAAALERSELLRDHVIEVSGLSTPALQRLVANARALLMPSFVEGFGLPIVEALACGTPAIASDLASHREAGGAHATYLSPIDGVGWLAAIRAHAGRDGERMRAALAGYRPWTWTDYFRRIEPFMVSLARERSAPVAGAPPGLAARTVS